MILKSLAQLRHWAAALTAAAAAVPLVVAAPGTAEAEAAGAAVTCSGNGPTYAINTAGHLLREDMPNPLTGGTLPATAGTIDTGWSGVTKLMEGPGATMYGIKSDGLYFSHRDTPHNTWNIHFRKISSDFGSFASAANANSVTLDAGGNIYTLNPSGQLRYYHYDSTTDTFAPGSGKIIDQSWGRYNAIFASDAGVIYARGADNHLYRSRYDVATRRWLERGVLVSSSNWSDTKSMSSYGGDTLVRVLGNGSVRYYRYDETTKNFPVWNVSVATGWQNYVSVSAAPGVCHVDTVHTPASPPVTNESFSPTAAFTSTTTSVELAYTDNSGKLLYAHIPDPAHIDSVQWTVISDEEKFSGEPTLAQHKDGRLVLTAHNTTSAVWQRNQLGISDTGWGDWVNLGGAMAQHSVVGATPDGLLAQFAVDADGQPWYSIQQRANVDFMGWMPLSGTGFVGPLTAVTGTLSNNGIHLFGRDASGVLSTALFTSDGALSDWTKLGTQVTTGTPAVVAIPGGGLRVFAVDGDGNVVTTQRSADGGAFDDWSKVPGVTAAGSPTALLSQTGTTEVVVRGKDNTIYETGEQTYASGVWRPWQQVSEQVAATDPTAYIHTAPSQLTWAFTFRTQDDESWIYEFNGSAAAGTDRTAAQVAPSFTARRLPAPPTH